MTRGVKVGVPSVFLVLLLVPAFQRTPAPRCPVVPPRERDGALRPARHGWRGGAAGARAALSLDPEALDLR